MGDPTLAPNQGSVNTAQANDRFTTSQAGFALAKCIVGAGCFVLPGAVKNAGLWLGTVSLLVLGAFTLYTISLLAWCANEYGVRKRHAASAAEWQLQQQQFYRYHGAQLQLRPEDAAAATETLQRLADEAANEPVSFVSMGRDLIHPSARHVIRLGILLTILGVLAVYLDLIGHLMEQVLRGVAVPWLPHATWTQVNVQWALALPLLLLANLRQLKYLAFTSILGMRNNNGCVCMRACNNSATVRVLSSRMWVPLVKHVVSYLTLCLPVLSLQATLPWPRAPSS
jgi:hypothetical protein